MSRREIVERALVGVAALVCLFLALGLALLARDVAAMRAQLDGTLVPGAERAGTMIENALARAVRTGSAPSPLHAASARKGSGNRIFMAG